MSNVENQPTGNGGPNTVAKRRTGQGFTPFLHSLQCRSGGKMCFPQLRAALVSVVCAIVFLSGCAAYYGTIGRASETQVASCHEPSFAVGFPRAQLAGEKEGWPFLPRIDRGISLGPMFADLLRRHARSIANKRLGPGSRRPLSTGWRV